jgi:hypothetical protein
MRVIVIVSHEKDDELKKIFSTFGDSGTTCEFTNNDRKIILYYKAKGSREDQLQDISTREDKDEYLLLYHLGSQKFNSWTGKKYDVGSKGNSKKSPNRTHYEKLIDTEFEGKIDTPEKIRIFDEVWNFFMSNPVDTFITKMQSVLNYRVDIDEIKENEFVDDEIKEVFNSFKKSIGDSTSPLDIPDNIESDLSKIRDYYSKKLLQDEGSAH